MGAGGLAGNTLTEVAASIAIDREKPKTGCRIFVVSDLLASDREVCRYLEDILHSSDPSFTAKKSGLQAY
jgi:hypothetical protein